jgi:hypothetical protein
MAVRHREEVLNTVLAQLIVARGLNANPEAIRRRGIEKPDVLIAFRGLRCVIEGKIADVANARGVVLDDAMRRLNSGLTQLAIAVVYQEELRATALTDLTAAMAAADYQFCICTEAGSGDWREGPVDEILDALRRAHDVLATDDAVKVAADELSVGLQEVANVFIDNSNICDRLVELLGIGTREREDGDSD